MRYYVRFSQIGSLLVKPKSCKIIQCIYSCRFNDALNSLWLAGCHAFKHRLNASNKPIKVHIYDYNYILISVIATLSHHARINVMKVMIMTLAATIYVASYMMSTSISNYFRAAEW